MKCRAASDPDRRHNGAKAGKATGAQFSDQRGDGASRQRHAAGDHIADPDRSLALSPDAVRRQLQRILDSPAFEASERRKRFLRYVVDELLAGRADRLKGYAIATDVFGRDESFDPQTDPVVRLEARRLRRALERYYLTGGRYDSIRIEIPKGGYVPTFTCHADEMPTRTPPASIAPWHRMQRRLPGRRWLASGAFALAGAFFSPRCPCASNTRRSRPREVHRTLSSAAPQLSSCLSRISRGVKPTTCSPTG